MPNLQLLDLTSSCMGVAAARALAPCHTLLQRLTTLGLCAGQLGADGVAALAPCLQTLPSLLVLALQHNQLQGDAADALSSILRVRAEEGRLHGFCMDVSDNAITEAGAMHLCHAAVACQLVTAQCKVDVKRNELSEGAKHRLRAVRNNIIAALGEPSKVDVVLVV